MKIISDISLKDFAFWSGAKDTAEKLTDEQFEQVEAALEDMYPDGMTDTQLNDLFWFDSETVYNLAGMYPKFYKITSPCGMVKFIRAENEDEADNIERDYSNYEETDEAECRYEEVESADDFDFDEFENTTFFKVTSYIGQNTLVFKCVDDDEATALKEAFGKCNVEDITDVSTIEEDINNAEDWPDWENDQAEIDKFVYNEDAMYNYYDIPVYAIPRICKLILDPNDFLDYYEVPESHAINEYNRYLELNDEEIKNIDEFVANLNKIMPQGFTIDWDEESIGSPYFEPYPAFGKAMDCVKLRVYPKAKTTA